MKRFVFCLFISGLTFTCVQSGLSEEGRLAFAGIRIVSDPDFAQTERERGKIRISELVERTVKNPQGQDLGHVSDLVIDREGRISFVLISGEPEEGNLIPVPFKSLLFGGYENWLILSNVNKAKFQKAPCIRKDQWGRLGDPAFEKEVFSYYGGR